MKTLVLSMISIAATVAAMTACTSESDEIDNVVEAKVPIELNAGVMEITTKAVINEGDAFDAQVIASETSNVYTKSVWETAGDGNIKVDAQGKVTFDPIQYYPTDGTTLYMKGFAPRGTVTNGVVAYTINGKDDIMVSNEISGSRTNKAADGKKLEFNHLLTQLQIKVVASDADAIEAWGAITGIEVVDASTSVELNLGGENAGKLIEAVSKTTDNVPVDKDFSTSLSLPQLPANAAEAGNVMVLPSTTPYKLLIKTEKNTAGISISTSVKSTEASKAYEITLTFKSSNIDITASAGVWTPVPDGSGIVE